MWFERGIAAEDHAHEQTPFLITRVNPSW